MTAERAKGREERCRELREALEMLKAQVNAKPADAAPDWIGGVEHPGHDETLRGGSPDAQREIRNVERAMEAEGCLD